MGAVEGVLRIIFLNYIVLLWCSTALASCQVDPEKHNASAENGNVQSHTTQNFKVDIMLPFFNIEIDNLPDNAKIVKNNIGVFVLSGRSIFYVNITHEKKEFNTVGQFSDIGEGVTGFEAIPWENHVIFLISLIDHFNVYITELPTPDNILVHPVQKVAIYGKFRKFSYFTAQDDMYLVMATNFTELHGRLSLYKWDHSYFHLKEEKNVQPVSDIIGFSDSTKPILFTIKYGKHRSKTSIQTFIIDGDSLKRIQNFYLDSNVVFPFPFHNNHYIVACSSRTKICTTYIVTDSELTEFNQESFNETFIKFSYGKDYIVGERPGGEFIIATDIKMRCFAGFKSNETDLSYIMTHTDNQDHRFVLLIYTRPPKVIIQVVEISLEAMEDSGNLTSTQSNYFDESFTRLRNFLLSSLNKIDTLKNAISANWTQGSNKIITKSPIYVSAGKVEKVNIIGKDLIGFQKLSASLGKLRENLRSLKRTNEKAKRSAGIFKAKKLIVNNLVYNGTVFEGTKLKDGQLIISTTNLTTNTIENNTLEIRSNVSKERTFESDENPISRRIFAKNLIVKSINGIDWETFYQTLFLKTQGIPIQGTLSFQEPVHAADLITNKLNKKETSNFFTLTTEQEVHSSLLLSKFRAPSLQADLINGLQFDRDLVVMGATETYVKSSIVARWVKIENDLTLSEEDHKNFARYVFGDEASDFMQIYSNKVIINGSLTLKNINLNKEGPKIYVAGEEFDFNFKERYWLKSTEQEFDKVIFKEPVTVQKLDVNYLNGNNFSNFLLNNREPEGHAFIIFNSSTVLGNVRSNQEIPSSRVAKINANVIRKFERTHITGVKEFISGFSVDILETEALNDIPVDDMVKFDSVVQTFKGEKQCSNIIVEDEFVVDDLQAKKVNAVDVNDFFKTAVTLDKELVIQNLTLSDNANFGTIFCKTLNNFRLSEFMDLLEISDDNILLHKDISIEGKVIFEKNLNTTWINGIKWNDYYNLLVFLDSKSQIGGVKIFVDSVTVTDRASIRSVNGVDFDEFTGNLLSKSKPQTIRAPWSFGSVQFNKCLTAPIVDGIQTDLLIDSRDPRVIINSDLVVNDLEVAGSMSGKIDLDFVHLKNKLRSFDQNYWKNVKILQSAELDLRDTDLSFLLENAVRVDGHQVIAGKITFRGKVHVHNVDGDFLINGIDIFAIYNDSLLKRADSEQVITVEKKFAKPVKIRQLFAHSFLAAQVLNNIDIVGFNDSIFRLTEDYLVSGRKTFISPPFITYLNVYGTINQVDMRNVVTTSMYSDILPPIRFSDIVIKGRLTTEKINELDLNHFLNSRARKSGPSQEFYGHLTFESLILKNTTLTSINEIDIDDVLLQDSQSLQEIYGTKRISGNLHLLGPAHIVNLNTVDLTSKFEQSIFLHDNVNLQSVTVNRTHFVDDIYVNGFLNGRPVDEYFNWFKRFCEEISEDIEQINTLQNTIQSNVDRLFLGQRFLYLEYDSTKIIFWNRTSSNALSEQIINPTCRVSEKGDSCQTKKILIQVLPDRIYLNYLEDTEMLKSRLQNLQVVIQNKRMDNITEMSLLWESGKAHTYYQKNITFEYMIENVETFEVLGNPSKFLLVQFYPGPTDTPIILIKLDAVKNQPLPIQVLKEFQKEKDLMLQLYNFHDKTFLITAAKSTIFVYEFSTKEEIFRGIQNITGLYNTFDLVQVESHLYHLLLSCKTCDHIAIYEINVKFPIVDSNFYLFQTIRIRKHVNKISHFINNSGKFLIITTQRNDGYYYLYKYSFVEGWLYMTRGYFANIHHATPLQDVSNYEDYILLASGNSSAAVLAYSQG